MEEQILFSKKMGIRKIKKELFRIGLKLTPKQDYWVTQKARKFRLVLEINNTGKIIKVGLCPAKRYRGYWKWCYEIENDFFLYNSEGSFTPFLGQNGGHMYLKD